MKPIVIIILLLLATFCSCKKDKPVPPSKNSQQATDTSKSNNGGTSALERDYMFIPMKDVTWIIHCQGSLINDIITGEYIYDTTYHFYTVVTALNKDTTMNNWHYYLFSSTTTTIHGTEISNPKFNGNLFINEDTLEKKVYYLSHLTYYTGALLIDYNAEIGSGGQQNSYVTGLDSMLIDGIQNQRWYGVNTKTNLPCFIQAYGIGRQYGIEGSGYRTSGNLGQIKSLDFIYKGDTIHIDFPFSFQG